MRSIKIIFTTSVSLMIMGMCTLAFGAHAGFDSNVDFSDSGKGIFLEEDEEEKTGLDSFSLREKTTIEEGVYIGSVHLGGMNPEEANEAIDTYMGNAKASLFTFVSGDKKYETTLKNLGFHYSSEKTVKEAAYIGKTGMLIARYKMVQDLKYDKVNTPISYSFEDDKLADYIRDVISKDDLEATDATITRKDGRFVTTPEVNGVSTNVEATIENVNKALRDKFEANMTVEVATSIEEAHIKEADIYDIKDKLGTYTTNYSNSNAGRKTNVKVGSSNMNGKVLLNGDKISVSQTMKERTKENGYQLATEYLSGESVEAYGGGVCQVATTFYQAALRAELEVNKRYNHSMLVSYVDPSYDAAISWGNKDLVITNTTGHAIYIAASADGNSLTFSIYGTEYRPSNRKITFESVIISRTKSETKIVEDPKQPIGFTEKKGSNHDKCESCLVKKVYVDGKLKETIKLNQDSYQASFETITKGTMQPVVPTTPSVAPSTSPSVAPTTESQSAGN